MKRLLCLLFFATLSTYCMSQDLVYKPKNPAFGGDTFNYQWLLSSAESQNKIQEKSEDRFGLEKESEFDRLTQSLNQQFINQLSRDFYTNRFGENNSLEPGNYTIGSLSVEVKAATTGLAISILDTNTGESTTLILPYY